MTTNKNQFYELHFYYAMHLHYQCEKYESALEHYTLALAIEDNWAITYFHISRVLLDIDKQNKTNNNYSTSLFFLKKAYKYNSNIPMIISRYQHNRQQIRSILREQEKVMHNHDAFCVSGFFFFLFALVCVRILVCNSDQSQGEQL